MTRRRRDKVGLVRLSALLLLSFVVESATQTPLRFDDDEAKSATSSVRRGADNKVRRGSFPPLLKTSPMPYNVIGYLDHPRPVSFTEGLDIYYDEDGRRVVLESSGMWGFSFVRKLVSHEENVSTASLTHTSPSIFGEGLTKCDRWVVQLTYFSRTFQIYDAGSLRLLGAVPYPRELAEGWGLTSDPNTGTMYASDGTNVIYVFRNCSLKDPSVMEVDSNVRLNDVAFDAGRNALWAVIADTPCVIKVNLDPQRAKLAGWLDLAAFRPPNSLLETPGDMNGLAVDPTNGHLLFTGKNWPRLHEIEILDEDDVASSTATATMRLRALRTSQSAVLDAGARLFDDDGDRGAFARRCVETSQRSSALPSLFGPVV